MRFSLLSLFLLFSLISLSFIFSILKSMDIMLQLPLFKHNSLELKKQKLRKLDIQPDFIVFNNEFNN